MQRQAYVGTSGWTYDAWKADFYADVPRRAWLTHYARHFRAVEVNATFYHQPKQSTLAGWLEKTPPDFRFALKGHRYLTHVMKLEVPLEMFVRQRQAAAALGGRLAAIVWQLPAGLKRDLPRLKRFARLLDTWKATRHALEFRDPSWFDKATAACLCRHRLAACQSDSAGWPLWNVVTTDIVYVRLHGNRINYCSPYTQPELLGWAKHTRLWLAQGRDVHIYFDNTDAGHALRDAQRLARMLA